MESQQKMKSLSFLLAPLHLCIYAVQTDGFIVGCYREWWCPFVPPQPQHSRNIDLLHSVQEWWLNPASSVLLPRSCKSEKNAHLSSSLSFTQPIQPLPTIKPVCEHVNSMTELKDHPHNRPPIVWCHMSHFSIPTTRDKFDVDFWSFSASDSIADVSELAGGDSRCLRFFWVLEAAFERLFCW